MIEFKIKDLKTNEVRDILEETYQQFTPPLLPDNQVVSYSEKLATNAYFAVAEVDNKNAGIIAYYLNKSESQIYVPYVFVYEPYRKRHLATQLMEYVISQNIGYKTIALEVIKTNKAAFSLYSKCNFNIKDTRADTYLMQRDLTQSITS